MEHVSSADCQTTGEVNRSLVGASHTDSMGLRPWGDYDDRETLIEKVMDRIAKGESLTKVCEDRGMPSVTTFFRWIQGDETKWSEYLRAREIQAHVFASRVVDVTYEQLDPATIKVRMDALKWAAARGSPKHFGDSTQLRHADADGGKLDTAPLVSELLALMPGATPAPAAAAAKPTHRVVSESRIDPPATQSARPAYRPRVARSDVDDLV